MLKRLLRYLVAVFAVSIIAIPLYSQTCETDTCSLRILSWNIYMLPRFVKNNWKITRARLIGDSLANSRYDVLVFQEAFHSGARKKISKALKNHFPYSAGPANRRRFSLHTNSGLWIFSKYPIIHSSSILFGISSGVDAFARKGALLVEIQLSGNKRVQVIATHLQSSGSDHIRLSQLRELNEKLLLANQHPDIPQIVCGDFNIDASVPAFGQMVERLNATKTSSHPVEISTYDRCNNTLCDHFGGQQEIIDHILLTNILSAHFSLQKEVVQTKANWHSKHKFLSDHHALEAFLRLY